MQTFDGEEELGDAERININGKKMSSDRLNIIPYSELGLHPRWKLIDMAYRMNGAR